MRSRRFYYVRMEEDTPTHLHFARGLLLYQQDRYAMAEAELRLALAEEPDHAGAHAILALCLAEQGQIEPAAVEARQAIRCDPEYAFAHYALAQVYIKQDRNEEAEESVRQAIRLDPTFAGGYSTLAAIVLDRGDPITSVELAEQGLAHDPEHAHCSAIRTLALLRLGRTGDATEETAEALRRNPQDSLAHAGHGWALLHAKKPTEALTHFREALRIDPTNEWARDGLVEALKARYWVYRQMLSFFLWMSRLGPRVQWMVILGLLVVQQVLASIARNQPAVRPFVEPVLLAFFGFVLLTWLADPLFTLMLRLNRFGRLVLNDEEKRQSNWVAGGIIAGLIGRVVWILGLLPYSVAGMFWAMACSLMLIPLAASCRFAEGWRRWLRICYTAGMVMAAVAMMACFVISLQYDTVEEVKAWLDRVLMLFRGIIFAGIGGGLLANILITIRR